MKRDNLNLYVAILIITAVIFSFLTIYAFGEHKDANISVSARSAVLYQPDINSFIYSKNSDERLPMASTTKIMTALVALERCELDELVAIDDSAIGVEGSSAYLRQGDVLTMEELLYALLLQSANDAAVAIACHISGDVENFSALMNDKADELKLSNTHFTNPHGLDSNEHYTTAKELAVIASEALKNESFRKIVSTSKRTFITEERTRTYVNHNKLLRLYDGCVGIKTGFTKKSGRCLVGAAEKDGLTFITVTLDAPSDWNDHERMFDYGFSKLEKITLAKEFDHVYKVPLIDGNRDSVLVANTNGAEIIKEINNQRIDEQLKLVRYAIAPVNQGDVLGEIIYSLNESEIVRIPLVATETIDKKEKQGFFKKIYSIFDQNGENNGKTKTSKVYSGFRTYVQTSCGG